MVISIQANDLSMEIIAKNGFLSENDIIQMFENDIKIEFIGWSSDSKFFAYRQEVPNIGFNFLICNTFYDSPEEIITIVTNESLEIFTPIDRISLILNQFYELLSKYNITYDDKNKLLTNINDYDYNIFDKTISCWYEHNFYQNKNVIEGIDWILYTEVLGNKLYH
jgi:hypothetical protein